MTDELNEAAGGHIRVAIAVAVALASVLWASCGSKNILLASQTSGGGTGGTGSGGTSGGTGGGGCRWDGDRCVVGDCGGQPDFAACDQSDGGPAGICLGGACHPPLDVEADAENCGFYGAACPPGATCDRTCFFKGARASCADGGSPCPPGRVCVDDPHGGDGGFFSPASGTCVVTNCASVTDGMACPVIGGLGECCGEVCRDSRHDPANCGGCGVSCAEGNLCDRGRCQPAVDCTRAPAGTPCSAPDETLRVCCQGACSDLGGSACFVASCNSASEGLACSRGQGQVGMCCHSSCVATGADRANCGSCGQACGPGTSCTGGSCVPTRSVSCAHNPNQPSLGCCAGTLTNVFSDPTNCGRCGTVCPVDGGQCVFGSCVLDGGGAAKCSSGSASCPAGTTCAGGACLFDACGPTRESLPCYRSPGDAGVCCNGQCVDTAADSANCGACGASCPSGTTCQSRQCLDDAGASATCLFAACGSGTDCIGSNCLVADCSGRGDSDPCAFGPGRTGLCCNGRCVDLRQAGACGTCGSNCPSGICLENCLSQPTDDCTPGCDGGTVCALGQCVGGLCLGSSTPCARQDNGVGLCCDDGACADLSTDPSHCGTCDVHCPSGQLCASGRCSGEAAVCTGRAGGYCQPATGLTWLCCGGACTDVANDLQNCGSCGVACASSQSCHGGSCN